MLARSQDIILGKVIDLVRETLYLPGEEITSNTDLKQDFGLDSLDVLQAFLDLEAEFGFEFAHKDAWECSSLGDLAAYIGHQLPNRAAVTGGLTIAA
jgi:acyl carrier protein